LNIWDTSGLEDFIYQQKLQFLRCTPFLKKPIWKVNDKQLDELFGGFGSNGDLGKQQ
jgi:hypothetical protein